MGGAIDLEKKGEQRYLKILFMRGTRYDSIPLEVSISDTEIALREVLEKKKAVQKAETKPSLKKKEKEPEILALEAEEKGEVEKALLYYDEALKKRASPELWIKKAHLCAEKGDVDEAIASYKKAAEMDPSRDDAWFEAGKLLHAKGEKSEAKKMFIKARNIQPEYKWYSDEEILCPKCTTILPANAKVCFTCGTVVGELAEGEELIECTVCGAIVESSAKTCPRCSAIFAFKTEERATAEEREKILGIIEEAAESPPEISVSKEELKRNLADAIQEREWHRALKLVTDLIEIEESDEIWVTKGYILTQLKRFKDSIVCYKRAVDVNPKNTKVLFNIGYSLLMMGYYERALRYFDKMLQIYPNHTYAAKARERCLKALGRL